MSPFSRTFAILPLVLLGCSAPAAEKTGQSTSAVLGTPGVADAADHGCNIVLRDVAAPMNGGGYDTNCVDNAGVSSCWVIFNGDLDVSAEAVSEGDLPYVYYQSGSDPTWYSVPAYETSGGGVGMERFSFSLVTNTEIQGQPFGAIEVIPYLQTVVGTRLFDHNEYAGNYELDSDDGWAIHPDGSTCYDPPPPATGTISFQTGWTQSMSGALNGGGKLVVDYDLGRMPQCEGVTTDGVSAWNTQAYAYFQPGGELLQGSVKGFYDSVTSSWESQTFATDIPYEATSVAIWFETSGDGCATTWDSDYGQNYNYAIGAPLFAPESGPSGTGSP
jgi:Family of unknown function (DUF6209)